MKLFQLPLLAILSIVVVFAAEEEESNLPPIVYRRVTTFDAIYDDSGTGAKFDLSIWRPTTNQDGMYALGDVAVASHGKPATSAVMVKESQSGALAQPASFTEMWNDRGSMDSDDVRFMRMNPPSGYTCIGAVAVKGYSTTPDARKYRCVKTEYVEDGFYHFIWNDKGSGASKAGSVWGIRPTTAFGLDTNCFGAQGSYATPTTKPKTINGKFAKSTIEISTLTENIHLTVYETPDITEVANDHGSGASRDMSIWRSSGPSGRYSLGDIGVSNYGKPVGFVVKGVKDDALAVPVDFREVWGLFMKFTFWEPICSPGYRAIGHVVSHFFGGKPTTSVIRCVKAEYTVVGKWRFVWNDAGTGESRDASVWKAIPGSIPGQGVQAMTTIASHMQPGQPAYVLKRNITQYRSGPAVKKYLLRNVEYLFDDNAITDIQPTNLRRTVLENKGDTVQKGIREFSYTYSETTTFSSEIGIEIGVEVEAKAGVPLVGEATVTTSISTSFTFSFGNETSKETSDSITAEIEVQPRSSKEAIIEAKQYKTDVRYTAELTTVYEDGKTSVNKKFKGVYKGVQVSEVRVVFEKDIPYEDQ